MAMRAAMTAASTPMATSQSRTVLPSHIAFRYSFTSMSCRDPPRVGSARGAPSQWDDNTKCASASRQPRLHRVAGIAVLAGPLRIDLLAEVLEDEPRPTPG